ncbi:uncharacterized protein MYCFIDRAFT_170321 [Pseudocercospora fijiensis CIRAD86]|uniref:Uncharacterized protein n=1 Tax=Pseudocercospora fijiensis (strain CIRAD86) TaxID=383855 RepID=N1Q7N5_PSEFD|nr:uncharacterized protein MYCFIDRAFT_170321 [Pseudocercospora fijiensis CIRAD86]EME88734.1 hypothetical protein MYCFIDRAFT_170321 [Pseudocercospora fijiensis CIRAD86]
MIMPLGRIVMSRDFKLGEAVSIGVAMNHSVNIAMYITIATNSQSGYHQLHASAT